MKGEKPHLAFVEASYRELRERSGCPMGSVAFAIYELEKSGDVVIAERGSAKTRTKFRLPRVTVSGALVTKPAEPRPAPVSASPIKLTTKVALRLPQKEVEPPSADDLPDPPSTANRPRSLVSRKPGQCAYPINNPAPGRGEETEYCCAPVAGKLAYCADHAKAMFVPRSKAR